MKSYRIPEIIKQYTHYDMIQSHTDLPDFPEFRTRLLFTFLNGNAKQSESSELYALVTSLIQMALDTHDLVAVSNDVKEKKAARSRQLKVLAGDYFSARFYSLLAQAGEIECIKRLSAAVCEVNRMKMNLYLLMKQLKITAEQYISYSVDLRAELYLSYTSSMEEAHQPHWPDLLKAFIRCEVILEEIYRTESLANFNESWGFWHIWNNGSKEDRKQLQVDDSDQVKIRSLLHKYHIASQLYQLLDSNVKLLSVSVKQLGSDKLISELFHIGEPFFRMSSKPKVLEEI